MRDSQEQPLGGPRTSSCVHRRWRWAPGRQGQIPIQGPQHLATVSFPSLVLTPATLSPQVLAPLLCLADSTSFPHTPTPCLPATSLPFIAFSRCQLPPGSSPGTASTSRLPKIGGSPAHHNAWWRDCVPPKCDYGPPPLHPTPQAGCLGHTPQQVMAPGMGWEGLGKLRDLLEGPSLPIYKTRTLTVRDGWSLVRKENDVAKPAGRVIHAHCCPQ